MSANARWLAGPVLGAAVLAGVFSIGSAQGNAKIKPGVVVKVVVTAEGCRRGLPERPELQIKWFLDTSETIDVASLEIVGPDGAVIEETREGLDEGFRLSLEAETRQGAHRIMLKVETADGDEMRQEAGFAVDERGCGVLAGQRLFVGNLSMHTSE